MRSPCLTYATTLLLATVMLGLPCSALLAPGHSSDHSCCEEQEGSSKRLPPGCEEFCAASQNVAAKVQGAQLDHTQLISQRAPETRPLISAHVAPSAEARPYAVSCLYLQHSSLLI